MPRAVRSRSTPSICVRFPSRLASWIPLAAGLLAAATPADLLAQTTTPAGAASVTRAVVPPAMVPTPKRATWSLHLHGGLFAPIDVNATSPTLGSKTAETCGSVKLFVGAPAVLGW